MSQSYLRLALLTPKVSSLFSLALWQASKPGSSEGDRGFAHPVTVGEKAEGFHELLIGLQHIVRILYKSAIREH